MLENFQPHKVPKNRLFFDPLDRPLRGKRQSFQVSTGPQHQSESRESTHICGSKYQQRKLHLRCLTDFDGQLLGVGSTHHNIYQLYALTIFRSLAHLRTNRSIRKRAFDPASFSYPMISYAEITADSLPGPP